MDEAFIFVFFMVNDLVDSKTVPEISLCFHYSILKQVLRVIVY